MKNPMRKLNLCLGSAVLAGLICASGASAAWEPAKNVDNQSSAAGNVGWYVGLGEGGNGTSTVFFDQTVGSSSSFYAIRRSASDSAWSAPAPAAFPTSNPFVNQPVSAAADANGNAISAAEQNAGGVPGVFAAGWPASASGPGSYSLLMSTPSLQGGVTDPQLAFDSSGNGYAVAGVGQGAGADEPILISSYSPSTGTWSKAAPISLPTGTSACAPNTTDICGQEPRLAVSSDGTVVVAYLKSTPSSAPGVLPATYNVYAVRAPAGAVAGSGGAASFLAEHQISGNQVQVTSNPGATPSTTPPNFDVAIDGADVTTIVDAESQSGANNAVFATRWEPGLDPAKGVQISTSQPLPPASEPRVAAAPSGDVTAMWTENSPNPQTDTLVSAELASSAKNWTSPVTVSSSVDNPGGPGGYSVNTPPFWLAADSNGTAYAVWTNAGALQDSVRQAGKAWSDVAQIDGLSSVSAVAGTARVATGPAGQADALVVASNGTRNALYATRFTSPLPPPSSTPTAQPHPGPPATSGSKPRPEVPCLARPVLRLSSARASTRSIRASGVAHEHVCKHASAAQHRQNHVVKVYVTIYHPAPLGKCQFLKRNGKLTPTIPCTRPVRFVARGTRSWSLRLNIRVPAVKGGFLVRAWAVDGFGRLSVKGPASVKHLKLPKPKRKHKQHR